MDLPTLTFKVEHIAVFAELVEIGVLATERVIRIPDVLGISENSEALVARLA